MGQPDGLLGRHPLYGRRTRGTETSYYPQEKKIKHDSPSSGERTGISPNRQRFGAAGVVGPRHCKSVVSGRVWKVPPQSMRAAYTKRREA